MDFVLSKGEIVCIGGDARDLTISCRQGTLWITQEGDRNDYLLAPGESFAITRKGKIAINAVEESCIHFADPVEIQYSSHAWQLLTS